MGRGHISFSSFFFLLSRFLSSLSFPTFLSVCSRARDALGPTGRCQDFFPCAAISLRLGSSPYILITNQIRTASGYLYAPNIPNQG